MLTKGETASCQNDSSNPSSKYFPFLLPQSFPSFFIFELKRRNCCFRVLFYFPCPYSQ